MFSGIVEGLGTVTAVEGSVMTVRATRLTQGAKPGDSIAVNGVCLTVETLGRNSFSVNVMPETVRRSNLGALKPGSRVNLERPLALGDRLGGHMVQGHVDGRGRVTAIVPEGDAHLVTFQAPRRLMRYVVEKGFVTVDGVSLTVVKRSASKFSVSIVKYTHDNTLLGLYKVGDEVNLEVDVVAKYVEQIMIPYLREGQTGSGKGGHRAASHR